MTGRENIYLNGAILGMRRHEITKKLDEIIAFSGVERYIDTPVKRYSSGMYVRLAFAVAAHLESEILIVDEVLAVGDAEFQKKCLGKMGDVSKNEGRTVLFVSHNMGAIQNLCNKAIHLKNGQFANMGIAKNIVSEYLSERNNLSNYKEFNKFLVYAKIEQVGEKIVLTAEYDLEDSILMPSLGFVLYNNEGIPIFGTNPIVENLEFTSRAYQRGKIEVTILEPKLIDGDYLVSIWFGDGKENFLEDLECLTFEVSGMSTNKQLSQSIVGNIIPKTIWEFK
jgi:lipopolysaccharide transport system ATP-binding protein